MNPSGSQQKPSLSVVNVREVSNVVEMMIGEMKKNRVLWDLIHPQYKPKRKSFIEEISKRTGIKVAKLEKVVCYVKSQYINERKRILQQEKEGTKAVKSKWKWYNHCAFLKDITDIQPKFIMPVWSPSLYLRPQADEGNHDFLEKTSSQPAPEEATSSSSTITVKSFSDLNESTDLSGDDQPWSNQPVSTTQVYIVDPDTDMVCKSEDEDMESLLLHQSDSAIDVLSPESQSEEEPENPLASRPAISNAKRKFIIDGVCASVSFQLSNDELCEDDLVAFHSDLIRYMHSYFNKRKKK